MKGICKECKSNKFFHDSLRLWASFVDCNTVFAEFISLQHSNIKRKEKLLNSMKGKKHALLYKNNLF